MDKAVESVDRSTRTRRVGGEINERSGGTRSFHVLFRIPVKKIDRKRFKPVLRAWIQKVDIHVALSGFQRVGPNDRQHNRRQSERHKEMDGAVRAFRFKIAQTVDCVFQPGQKVAFSFFAILCLAVFRAEDQPQVLLPEIVGLLDEFSLLMRLDADGGAAL